MDDPENAEHHHVIDAQNDKIGHTNDTAPTGTRQPRSCTECCRRKVRCDRSHPCNHCTKHNSTCIFPTRRKSAHRPRRSIEANKASKIQSRLVDEVATATSPVETRQRLSVSSQDADRQHPALSYRGSISSRSLSGTHDRSNATQLNVAEGRSRYVGNQFWVSMSEEVPEMRDVLEDSSPDDETASHRSEARELIDTDRTSRMTFMFEPVSRAGSLWNLVPDNELLLTMFDIYQENVDPVARIFHRDLLRKVVNSSVSSPNRIEKNTAPVLFALCFAAVVSIDEMECTKVFKETQQQLIARYRFAVEQSLSQASFVESTSLNTLAALVLFLLCVRRHDHSRFVSGMLGIAIRNAQAMGLHRDGTNFDLTPYETEIRRRIWWHICILDLRSSEDHGFEPSLFDHNYDTQFPSNLDDDDLDPESSQPKAERQGCSSMTFCLLRCEMTIAIKHLHYQPPGADKETSMDKEGFVKRTEKHFWDTYIRHCDVSRSIEWVSATWARLMLAKLWLAVYNPLHQRGKAVPLEQRRMAFAKAIDVLELADTLESSPRASKWRWLFLTHTQWHAVVFVLAYLCVMPSDPRAPQAWAIVPKVYERWTASSSVRDGMLWKPLSRIMTKAQQIQNNANETVQSSASHVPSINGQVAYNSEGETDHTRPIEFRRPTRGSEGQALDAGSHSYSSTHPSESTFDPGSYSVASTAGINELVMPAVNSIALASGTNIETQDFAQDELLFSNWDTIMHDVQLDMQYADDPGLSNGQDFMQRSSKIVWDTL